MLCTYDVLNIRIYALDRIGTLNADPLRDVVERKCAVHLGKPLNSALPVKRQTPSY